MPSTWQGNTLDTFYCYVTGTDKLMDISEMCMWIYRYKREEVKIQAWENHEKRKAEMEMKRMEVLLFRIVVVLTNCLMN